MNLTTRVDNTIIFPQGGYRELTRLERFLLWLAKRLDAQVSLPRNAA